MFTCWVKKSIIFPDSLWGFWNLSTKSWNLGEEDKTAQDLHAVPSWMNSPIQLSAWMVIELVAVEKAVDCHPKRTSGMDLIWICTPHWSKGPVNNYIRTWILLNSRHLIVIKNLEILDITDNNVLTAWIRFRDILKDWYPLLRFLQPYHTPIRVKIQLIMTYITHLQPRQLLADMHIRKEEEKA